MPVISVRVRPTANGFSGAIFGIETSPVTSFDDSIRSILTSWISTVRTRSWQLSSMVQATDTSFQRDAIKREQNL